MVGILLRKKGGAAQGWGYAEAEEDGAQERVKLEWIMGRGGGGDQMKTGGVDHPPEKKQSCSGQAAKKEKLPHSESGQPTTGLST